ncbi:PucR family transcriptional regulator [Anaerospora hongkongensis]|uniref:PucR family transcriptional regulator n=1 Tax=Anaerospora hongkongensis TaxID=244830 RepID=UPI00289BFF88|nr:helix-turn-helix domain-containing protein [Anaerospora hongkongensis]
MLSLILFRRKLASKLSGKILYSFNVEVFELVSNIRQLFQEELEQLAQIKSICDDQQYTNNELLAQYKNMAAIFERNLQSMMKMTRISDSQQLYLQEIQHELEREIEERIKAEEKVAHSYNRHRRNQFLLELAEGNRSFDDAAWNVARQLKLNLPSLFYVFYIQLTSWQGCSLSQAAVDAAEIQTAIDNLVDRLNSGQGAIAWEWGNGIGMLYAALPGETKERQLNSGLELKKQLSSSLPHFETAIGTSGRQGKADSFAYLCYQARAAANLGNRLWPERLIHHYHDGQAYQLLYPLADSQNAAEFIDRMIGKLLDYDKENNTELLVTLKKIIQAANLKIVAEDMFLHHKTIVSRKQRIESILGISLESFETRFHIAIALHLLQFRG